MKGEEEKWRKRRKLEVVGGIERESEIEEIKKKRKKEDNEVKVLKKKKKKIRSADEIKRTKLGKW